MKLNKKTMEIRTQKVNKLREKGLTYKQIGLELDLTKTQVSYCVNRDKYIIYSKNWRDGHQSWFKDYYYSFKKQWIKDDEKCIVCGKKATMRHNPIRGEREYRTNEMYKIYTSNPDSDMLNIEVNKTLPLCIICHNLIHKEIIVDNNLYGFK